MSAEFTQKPTYRVSYQVAFREKTAEALQNTEEERKREEKFSV
jgi:hypothetical protein